MTTSRQESGTCRWCGMATIAKDVLECDNCWELRHRIAMQPEMAQRMLDSYHNNERKLELDKELDNLWAKIEKERHCPHCGTTLDPSEDHLATSHLLDTIAYVCPVCNKVCDFPYGEKGASDG